MAQRTGQIDRRDDSRRNEFPLTFKNGSAETVPAFGIMQVDTVAGVPIDQARLVTIKKPDSTTGQYLVNGPLAVRAGKQGRCRLNGPMTMAYTGSAPALGDTVGPSSGSWLVSTAGSGYDVLGGAENGVVLCNNTGGGGGTALKWGKITTSASGSTTEGTPTTDGRGDVFADFGGATNITLKNYYPDAAAVNSVFCVDSNNVLVTWSCGEFA